MATQSLGLFFTSLKLPSLTQERRVGYWNFRVLSGVASLTDGHPLKEYPSQ